MKASSIFFLVIFTTFLVTPSVVTYLDGGIDVSWFFNMNEEEKTDTPKLDKEKQQHHEKTLLPEAFSENVLNKNTLINTRNHWTTIYFENDSPPPEHFVFIG